MGDCVLTTTPPFPSGNGALSTKKGLMKNTKVQTLGTVALQAIKACTDDASIVGCLALLSKHGCLVLHVVRSVHIL